jgi:hypothetical protein
MIYGVRDDKTQFQAYNPDTDHTALVTKLVKAGVAIEAKPPEQSNVLTAAPGTGSCNFAIYSPVECLPPRPMTFDLHGVMSLGSRVTPGDKGCVSRKDSQGDNRSMAPIGCRDDRVGGYYFANEDGVIGQIQIAFNQGLGTDDAAFMQLRISLERKFGPPTLVMRPFHDAKWESTDGAMLDLMRDDTGNAKIILSSTQGRADAGHRWQLVKQWPYLPDF